ncbi:MAG: hypothetical protein ACFE8B_01910 [Candidatus Hermodarchaeota archaeon]
MYDIFESAANAGVFFICYIMANLLFFPFIYSTVLQEKPSHNIKLSNKKLRQPRSYAYILFVISTPLVIWLIIGNIVYYSITEFGGGLGEFARNGFLTLCLLLFFFCIFPAIILSLKKNKNSS